MEKKKRYRGEKKKRKKEGEKKGKRKKKKKKKKKKKGLICGNFSGIPFVPFLDNKLPPGYLECGWVDI